jgi:predicted transcriptional regulator
VGIDYINKQLFIMDKISAEGQLSMLKTSNKMLQEKNDELKQEVLKYKLKMTHWKEIAKEVSDELDELIKEKETCPECHKALEGDYKCSEGCPEYDKGWSETHE